MWIDDERKSLVWEESKQWIWEDELTKDSVENLTNTKIEKIIQELFLELEFTESEEMKSIKKRILWRGENYEELLEEYKQAEYEHMRWKDSISWMKSQIWIILVKILYLCKNWKYDSALDEFDDLLNYLDNIPNLEDNINDLFDDLYVEIEKVSN